MKRVFGVIATAVIFAFPVSASGAQAGKPSWCVKSVGFCWATSAAVEETIEKDGAPAPIGFVWTGTGTSFLRVNSATCIGVLRYGRVFVTANNIYQTVDVSDEEWHNYATADDPSYAFVIGEPAYRVFDCSFSDARGRYHHGLYSVPKARFIPGG